MRHRKGIFLKKVLTIDGQLVKLKWELMEKKDKEQENISFFPLVGLFCIFPPARKLFICVVVPLAGNFLIWYS